jgi:hypothetical protein
MCITGNINQYLFIHLAYTDLPFSLITSRIMLKNICLLASKKLRIRSFFGRRLLSIPRSFQNWYYRPIDDICKNLKVGLLFCLYRTIGYWKVKSIVAGAAYHLVHIVCDV